ncbi:MAG: nucleotidyltransferase [Imperialibacter sp.]|uniref:nucleotidyltransferase n=1 Tax=Imperialibacter sp. TaxID=2038411 RepID=UPI0032F07189
MVALIRLLLTLGIVGGLIKLFSNEDQVISENSNCQDEFLTFNRNLNIPASKLKRLKRARRAIQKAIKSYFQIQNGFSIPKFALQGSYATGTMIRTAKDMCDFDLGIYFFEEPSKTYETIQNHIKRALTGHTTVGISLLPRCVRLKYRGDFHIDMPIYYTLDEKAFYLGARGDEWELCDSKVFKDWVADKTKESLQSIRIIRYFKAWADHYRTKKRTKMPSGLVFTIWSIRFYQSHERDDVAFVHTAAAILKHLKDNFQFTWTCVMPVAPNDNVLDKLNKQQQVNFRDTLEELVSKGFEALTFDNKAKAAKAWGKLLGGRFPSF